MAEVQKIPTGKFNPGYGCAILVIMVLTFSGIVTWVIHSLMEQNRQIAGFTQEKAEPLPEIKITDEQKAALKTRLIEFSDKAAKGEEVSLSLNVEDCATLFALSTDFGIGGSGESEPYLDLMRVSGFDAKARLLKTDLRLAMNNLKWDGLGRIFSGHLPWTIGRRYLVGTATFKPDIENGSFVIRVDTVTVPGKDVAEGFVKNLKNWDWLDPAKKKIGAADEAMKKVSSWRMAEDGRAIILECKKASSKPADGKP